MRKRLLTMMLLSMGLMASAQVDNILINDKNYHVDVIESQDIGPGIHHYRLRIPDYPLNVNILQMDMNNTYNRIETFQASDTHFKTEKLATAYTRYKNMYDDKRPIAGANGNFWCVSSQQPHSDLLIGATYNGNLRNGQIITETNAYSDQWDGGPKRTGVIAVDASKNLYIESMNYKGYAINDKIGSPEIIQANKIVRDNEIALYNSFYGRTKAFMPADQYKDDSGVSHFRLVEGVATEVYLTINEGQRWMAGQPMTCTVGEVKTNAGTGTLGDYDLCLVGRGDKQALLAKLVAGDQLTVNYGWSTTGGKTPIIEQLIGGNAIVMANGEMTGRNDDETYNSQVYSRCAYGSSADGRTLYIIVIDKSTDPVYGTSAGCNTRIMCQIAKHYGCANLCNVDAGGSAQMMIEGKVINKTTEGTPRAVANGWFLYSIAPKDETIARLEFKDLKLQAPTYATYSPQIIAYNQYGDIVDDDFKGFTLSCDASLGTCNGSMFTAGGGDATGELTASYNGVSVSKTMTVVVAPLAIRIKPLLIDAYREYPMEVTATIGEEVYVYDPAAISWTVENNDIISIDEGGVLRGLKEGKSMVVGKIGDFVDETEVTVEIAKGAVVPASDMTGWTIKGSSGITKGALAEDGTLSFTYGAPRAATIKMSKDIKYYSLPDKLWLEFTPSVNIKSINIDLRTPQHTKLNKLELKPSTGEVWEASKIHRIELPINELGNPTDLILYPISLHYIEFTIEINSAYKGEQSIKVGELSAEYNNYASVEQIIVGEGSGVKVYPNPTTDGVFTVSSSKELKRVDVYSIAGVAVASVECEDNAVTVNAAGLAKGVYFVKVETEAGVSTSKLVVK
ncbi:MAG: phosphodiester glycosidase family protein [Muribaculaceae bacterium]|nr:phosphodiester glycosidase family protein [Muribaculaceae bacterium]